MKTLNNFQSTQNRATGPSGPRKRNGTRLPAGLPVQETDVVAEAFAVADEARARELDRLIAAGFGDMDPKKIPKEK